MLLSFDVYGTLMDSRGGSREAFETILRAAGGEHVDPMDFQDHWELANIRRYGEPYRSYKTICRDSLAETFAHFGLRGDPALIQVYFDAYPELRPLSRRGRGARSPRDASPPGPRVQHR